MRILIFNWRDIKHPASGGAEILTHELARHWVRNGNFVVQFSSNFEGSKSSEIIDGVTILRRGHPDARYLFWSVHFLAFWYYLTTFRGKFDVVIDEIHGLPFFTPLYVRERKIALICEVADDLWFKIYGSFFGFIGRAIEVFYLRIIYRNLHFLTISNSTKKDLLKNGVRENHTHVIPMGIKLPKIDKTFPKEKDPTLIFVGRLSKSKGIEDAFVVLKKIKEAFPKAKLWVIGRGEGEYINFLKKIVKKLDLADSVRFFGFVSEDDKFELIARAHVLISPSIKEGYGLTIPEAGFVETPAVGYNVEGLRDVLVKGKNGLLVEPDVTEMSHAIQYLLEHSEEYNRMQKEAKKMAQRLSFEKSSKVSFELLQKNSVA